MKPVGGGQNRERQTQEVEVWIVGQNWGGSWLHLAQHHPIKIWLQCYRNALMIISLPAFMD